MELKLELTDFAELSPEKHENTDECGLLLKAARGITITLVSSGKRKRR